MESPEKEKGSFLSFRISHSMCVTLLNSKSSVRPISSLEGYEPHKHQPRSVT